MITHLFKQSLDTSELPPDWKTSYATPTFKKDKRIDLSDYRSISSTFILCKSFKHILVIQIMKHLEIHKMLCPNQLRFRTKHWCESQLLLNMHNFSHYMNNRTQVAYSRLVHKLEYYRIRRNLLLWIKSLLSNRSQQVTVKGSYSSLCNHIRCTAEFSSWTHFVFNIH